MLSSNRYSQKDLHEIQLLTYTYLTVIAWIGHVGNAPTFFVPTIMSCALLDHVITYMALQRDGIWTYLARCESTMVACAFFIAFTHTEAWQLWVSVGMLALGVLVSIGRLTSARWLRWIRKFLPSRWQVC